MAAIIVRNLDDEVRRRIKERAVANNRSMEAEARAILTSAVSQNRFVDAWLSLTGELRTEGVGLPELALPARSLPRHLDLS
ncbi:FitA-like ribbon-helix-helix domain-containing protein [Herbiconiux ginsengi]|uniref:Arc-like DNA binding domain-containing protein n=1 Tax=Herbiconiux ginsengi TaxID=381665 RepID=A0A1H3QSX5_9MICO|nr:Arc family DNA-binding protein [Herbiconiux ginsengi]SDZ16614.1 Arc-like DNA binding domain-containing protein [Herbiconiux ginsengi]